MGRNIRNKVRGGSNNTNKKKRSERLRTPKPASASAEMASLTPTLPAGGEGESKNIPTDGDAAVGGTELSTLLQGKRPTRGHGGASSSQPDRRVGTGYGQEGPRPGWAREKRLGSGRTGTKEA
jgi:hypothetical protein